MAKIKLPRAVRPVDLGAYSPEMREALEQAKNEGRSDKPLYMWVNPTSSKLRLFSALRTRIDENSRMLAENAEYLKQSDRPADAMEGLPHPPALIRKNVEDVERQVHVWWADIWSQGPSGTHWTPEEVKEFSDQCTEKDPGFWEWIHRECWRMVADYRARAKKA